MASGRSLVLRVDAQWFYAVHDLRLFSGGVARRLSQYRRGRCLRRFLPFMAESFRSYPCAGCIRLLEASAYVGASIPPAAPPVVARVGGTPRHGGTNPATPTRRLKTLPKTPPPFE